MTKSLPRLLLLLALAGPLSAAEPATQAGPVEPAAPRRFEFVERHMGFAVRLAFYAPDEGTANRIAREGYSRFAACDKIMSDYDPESELLRFCGQAEPGKPYPIGPDLLAVLTAAQGISAKTDGAFDVTVGPLTQMWRRSRRQGELPSPERLAEARAKVGRDKLRLDPVTGTAILMTPKMRLDLGGIAAGYAVDEVAAILARHRVRSFLIDAGGDVRVGDAPADRPHWRFGVAPLEADGPPGTFVGLTNRAVAHSGDAFQFTEIGGVRYSHIVDVRTGLGLTERIAVTTIAPDALRADAWSTALSCLGPEKGLPLIEADPDLAALIVRREADGLKTYASRRWKTFVVPAPPAEKP